MVGSDAIALCALSAEAHHLPRGTETAAILTPAGIEVFASDGTPVERPAVPVPVNISPRREGQLSPLHAGGDHEQPE